MFNNFFLTEKQHGLVACYVNFVQLLYGFFPSVNYTVS